MSKASRYKELAPVRLREWLRGLWCAGDDRAEGAPHDPECPACAQLARTGGRYKPPELLSELGYPMECIRRQ